MTPKPPLPPPLATPAEKADPKKEGGYVRWTPGKGQDPAAYVIDPGEVRSPSNPSSGNLRHPRPYLSSGKRLFVFPGGVEGFTRSGQAGLSIHRYLNDHVPDVHVFHREEGRIEITGTFPGITSKAVMTECLAILTGVMPEPGIIFNAPGAFDFQQYVVPETWNFTHAAGDTTHSIDYSITLIRTGSGKKVKDPHGEPAKPNPSRSTKPKGATHNKFVVASGAQTFRQIAAVVYNDHDKWAKLIPLNQRLYGEFQRGQYLNRANNLPIYSLPTFRWAIGTEINY